MNQTKAVLFKPTIDETREALRSGKKKEYVEIKRSPYFKEDGDEIIDFILFNSYLNTGELSSFLGVLPTYIDNIVSTHRMNLLNSEIPWRHPKKAYFFNETLKEEQLEAFSSSFMKRLICFFTYNFERISIIPVWLEQIIFDWVHTPDKKQGDEKNYINWAVTNAVNVRIIEKKDKENLTNIANSLQKKRRGLKGFYDLTIFNSSDFGGSLRYINFVKYLNALKENAHE